LAGILALTLGTTAISALPAHADTNGVSTTTSTSADPRYAALTQAASSGQPVTVDSLTTADSTTQALPDGTLATTTTLDPTRMKNSAGSWETIDPTLVANADGSVSTTATPNGLTLSGGGTGPVITATDPAGHSLALSLPVTLPSPTLSGASATYASVYPGVNLTVTAAPTGGFSEVFTVTDPTAEAQAQNIKFTTELTGLSMSQAADGSMTVTDPSTGQAVMSAPPAAMWDSSTTGAPATGVSDEFETVTGATSSAAGPGTDAHTGTLPITDSSGTLALNGAASNLNTSSPTYPLYLDPTWTEPFTSGGTQAYDEVEGASACTGFKNYNNISQPGVGDVTTNTDCPGPYETYFQIDTSTVLNPSYVITSAKLKINEVYSSLNSCGQGSEDISIYSTSPIGSGTDWANKPAFGQKITDKVIESDGNTAGTMCSGGTVAGDFDVSSGIALVRSANVSNWTFVMVGNETNGSNSLERFNNNPSIYTVYDIPPSTPDNATSWPTPVTGISSAGKLSTNTCPSSGTPGYLGIGNIGGSDIATLSARLTSQIGAAQMNATFTVHDMTANSTATYTSSGWAASGANVSIQTNSLNNGDEYSWSAKAWDQYYNSANSSTTCYLKVDTTPPSNPSIPQTSASWPPLASGTPSTVDAGTAGSFAVSATDAVSGIAGYYYSFDAHPVPSAGGSYQTTTTINYTPSVWGAHTLYVQSLDNAGNLSAVSSYSFYVPWNPASIKVNGSVSGGNVPDFVTNPLTGSYSGDLVMVPGDSNPDTTPSVISTPDYSPDRNSWVNYQVTHDGSYISHPGYDDLWAFQNTTHNLYLYLNTQSGTPFEATTRPNAISKGEVDNDAINNAYFNNHTFSHACIPTAAGDCSTYYNTDWSNVSQILAPGDLYAGDPNTLDVNGNTNGAIDNGVPGLLTVENGALWYYQGQSGPNYLGIAEQLGTSGWDATSTTLIGTTTTGSGTTTKTYLWARIKTGSTAGAIMQYPITFDGNGNLKSLGTPTGGSGTKLALPDAADNFVGTLNYLSTAGYPQLYAWDMHNTGHSDLIATTPSGTAIDWPGTTPDSNGIAQFTTPESLAAATSTSAITLASVGTDYPSGTTWDNGTSTLGFNQGQLTVTLDSTGKVITQYGTDSPGAYLTLQTDGNLVIYSSTNSVLWALNKLGATVASGDTLTLTGSSLTLKSGSSTWTAAASVPVSPGTIGETAFTTPDGNLGITIGAGSVYTTDPIATGTSPAIADLGGSNYEAAFQGANGHLETVSSSGAVSDTGYAMAANSSPSIAPLPSNGWIIVFQGSNADVETLTSALSYTDYQLGMAANTSPAIASNPTGGWEFAFQAAGSGSLWTHNGNGTTTNESLGMAPDTSPSIICLTTSGVEIAFQANTGSLWLWGDGTGGGDKSLGMKTGTSPAITALANGEWQAAFQANTGILWTVGNAPGSNTGNAMAAGTNPSIIATGGETYALAWQSSTNDLTTMAYEGSPANTSHLMSAGTSPTLAP
jgi:hypothetical protein